VHFPRSQFWSEAEQREIAVHYWLNLIILEREKLAEHKFNVEQKESFP